MCHAMETRLNSSWQTGLRADFKTILSALIGSLRINEVLLTP